MTPRRCSTDTSAEEDAMNRFSHEMKDNIGVSIMRTGRITSTLESNDDRAYHDDVCSDSRATPSTKFKSEEEEDDGFDIDDLPMPRGSSFTVPLVLEVAPRTIGFDSKDPLFGGICLYSGTMASERREELESRPEKFLQKKTIYFRGGLSWLLPGSIFSNHGA